MKGGVGAEHLVILLTAGEEGAGKLRPHGLAAEEIFSEGDTHVICLAGEHQTTFTRPHACQTFFQSPV